MHSHRVPSIVLLTVAVLGLVAIGMPAPARTAPAAPGLRLIAAVEETAVQRWGPDAHLPLDFGIYVAPVGGPFELRARRGSGSRIDVRQVVPHEGGVTEVRRLPARSVRSLREGLRDFFEVTVRTTAGGVVDRATLPFCPQSSFDSARVDESGPDVQRYHVGCWATPVSEALIWGIDRGWAVSVPGFFEEEPPERARLDVPDGTYDVAVAITPRYAELFDVDPADAVRSVRVTVTTEEWVDEPPEEVDAPARVAGVGAPGAHGADGERVVPEVLATASGLPDLVALPAWELAVHHEGETGRDYLVFAATVWNAGPGPLVVEGFRAPGSDLMQAYQYFYERGSRTGRAEVGTLEWDERDGHDHWHFTDFARYRLLDAASGEAVTSEKEAFCLANTDAVDLTIPGATLQPGSVGLHTACGRWSSLWTRQVLDAGWGDTYTQSTPGQSFDITDLANGTYLVEVATNPDERLSERSLDNNVALRRVKLGGEPGARTLRVLR